MPWLNTIQAPLFEELANQKVDRDWMVIVFNNEVNTYDEVMAILMKATGCDEQEAFIETWEIDHLGQSVVHVSGKEECTRVRNIIATIGIRVEVEANT